MLNSPFERYSQEIKEDLEAHSRPVSSCLDQIRQVVLTGSNVLSSEEVSTLERNGRSLKTRFDRASDRTERMVKRLIAARDDLVKFKLVKEIFSFFEIRFVPCFLTVYFPQERAVDILSLVGQR